MSRRTRHIAVIMLATLGLSSYALAAATGAVTITGSEQQPAGIWDLGTVTVSVNNYPETVPYGQYSTPASIASAIAAKFSSDCNGPANAKSTPGGGIDFQLKGSTALTQLSVTSSSGLSFAGTTDLSITPTTTTATIASALTVIPLGQSTTVNVQVSCDSACGLVDYRIDGGEWGTVALDANGQFSAATSSTLSAGLHNVVVNFQGNSTFMPSSSNLVSFTITSSSGALTPTNIYGYSITAYDGTGNVLAYNDMVNGNWSSLGYDSLNRLTAATQTNGGATQYFCWSYDSFGNRTAQVISSSPCSPPSPTVTYTASNQMSGLTYDAAGNVTNDEMGHQYLYDAEGRVCAVQYPVLTGLTSMVQYIYDAEGQRVAKGTISTWSCDTTSNGYTETAGYVLGPNGEQVTEVDGDGNPVHTNVFAAGSLIATYDNDQQGVHFHLDDWLGTRRVDTDYAGNPESTYQNLPFGELVPPNQIMSDTEHFFTGKERDTESGLDYFGARYYASSMGRWMSPDWADKPEAVPYSSLDNPQTLNLYGYVNNNPLSQADPDGHCCWDEAKQWISDHPRTSQAVGGVGKVAVGVGLVGTIAGGDVPGSVVGAGLVVSGTLSAVASVVSGVTDVTGAATNTNVQGAQKGLDSVSNVPALVTTAATGNPKAGAAVGTLSDAAQLAAKPQEALKNAATMAEAVKTGAGTADLVRSGASAMQGTRPPPPPPPPPPSCSVAGACK